MEEFKDDVDAELQLEKKELDMPKIACSSQLMKPTKIASHLKPKVQNPEKKTAPVIKKTKCYEEEKKKESDEAKAKRGKVRQGIGKENNAGGDQGRKPFLKKRKSLDIKKVDENKPTKNKSPQQKEMKKVEMPLDDLNGRKMEPSDELRMPSPQLKPIQEAMQCEEEEEKPKKEAMECEEEKKLISDPMECEEAVEASMAKKNNRTEDEEMRDILYMPSFQCLLYEHDRSETSLQKMNQRKTKDTEFIELNIPPNWVEDRELFIKVAVIMCL